MWHLNCVEEDPIQKTDGSCPLFGCLYCAFGHRLCDLGQLSSLIKDHRLIQDILNNHMMSLFYINYEESTHSLTVL